MDLLSVPGVWVWGFKINCIIAMPHIPTIFFLFCVCQLMVTEMHAKHSKFVSGGLAQKQCCDDKWYGPDMAFTVGHGRKATTQPNNQTQTNLHAKF